MIIEGADNYHLTGYEGAGEIGGKILTIFEKKTQVFSEGCRKYS
jgi:hypothetical protein